MTNRERVIAALEHRQPDRVPYHMGFTQNARAAFIERYGESALGLIDNAIAGVAAAPGPLQGMIEATTWQDEFGVQWDQSVDKDIGVVRNRVLPERDLSGLRFPEPRDPRRWEGFEAAIASAGDRCVQFAIGFSLFERAWTLRGMDQLFIDMIEAPEFVDDLLDMICDYNVAMVEQAVLYDIDMVHFGDDWGSQRGLLMGPKLWERFLAPRLERMYGAGKRAGRFVSIHSCGMVQEVFPRLIELGLDCFNPFQPEVMDPYEMKREFGDRLAFWGGVSTQRLLPYGTPGEVRAEVRRLIDEVGESGGYICAPAHAIPGDARPENVMAMLEVLNDQ
ncbi:MAG: uroporphyrinogen decarboxylase family protein [Armatimonadota bacterium]|jgi:uroporphyrinogen decarboxylase